MSRTIIPEIQAGIQMLLKTMDPGLKIAEVTNKGDRSIQGQAKDGSKVAGVTRRRESKGFCP